MNFKLSNADKKYFEKVVGAFQNHCKLLVTETYDRYKFFTSVQQESESFDRYITEIKTLASPCNFGELEDSLFRDKIVSDIRDLCLKERQLRPSNLSLKVVEEHCRASEISSMQVKGIRNAKEVDSVRFKKKRGQCTNNESSEVYTCLNCGMSHGRMSCPAFGKICNNCGKRWL
ncbi:unnamed protein product [Acanthoscelides obtectus]|uniref:Retrotransposon gag domain-containing protein n=1 Tax=Acanthoscelides obtectus TaxID=200917 RepID=A0A9P0KJR2_ACAOB|nr:unnamed protein product [Acanthoscelides obtectus]CAK1640887.1 hypothetical protein AOBTE_LOCUS11998 [Acanthoscelides obtectus]